MAEFAKRDRLRPWYIGAAIVAISDLITAYLFYVHACSAAGLTFGLTALLMTLVYGVLPIIYLGLMYLALKSQP